MAKIAGPEHYGQNYTKVTDNIGHYCTYQFNDYGNTTAVYNDRGQALFGRYAKDKNPNAMANQLQMSSRLQDTVINLLPNPSFETTSGWNGGYQTNTDASSGIYSMKISDANKRVDTTATVAGGKIYTLSGAFKATAGAEARLFITAGNTTVYSEKANINSWNRVELSIEVPMGVTSVTIGAEHTGTGDVYLDDFQFECADAASRYNLVTDSDITAESPLWKYNYGGGGDKRITVSGERGHLDTNAIQLDASYFVEKYAYQEIKIPEGKAGDYFTFGTWVKSGSVPQDNTRFPGDNLTRRDGIKVEIFNGDNLIKEETVLVNDASRDWQFISGTIRPGAAYTRVVVKLLHEYNHNCSYYDGVQVFRESFGYNYEYDDNGNLTKIIDLNGNETTYEYASGTSDVSKIHLPSGNTFSYTYNVSRNLVNSISATGVSTSHTYDEFGNCTITRITHGENGTGIQSDLTYTPDGNLTASITSDNRKTTVYNNDTDRSLLSSVVDPNGNATLYTYDVMNRLSNIASNDTSISYTYSDDRMYSSAHSAGIPTSYQFNYGVAGLVDSVVVGTGDKYKLTENTYNPDTWTLASQKYGNGNEWHYYYTDYGDIAGKYYEIYPYISKANEYRYFYNNAGQLARVESGEAMLDDQNNITSRFLYNIEKYYYNENNMLNRVILVNALGNVDSEVYWEYNQNNNATRIYGTVSGHDFSYNFGYDDDKQPTTTNYGLTNHVLSYDSLGRHNKTEIRNDEVERLRTDYSFSTVNGNETTQVSQLTNTYGNKTDVLNYTYDANGNILSISDGLKTVSYTYDRLNQLISEKNEFANKSWTYSYDSGGNILSKVEYNNATASGSGITVTYGYTDNQWGDLLTAVDGVNYSYDLSGNLINDGKFNYEWAYGRQLVCVYQDMLSYEYSYNKDGLRTSKNGTLMSGYQYRGNLLVSDTSMSTFDTLYFHYDNNDDIIGFTYKGTSGSSLDGEYYYVKNLQGDIIGILDAAGSLVASYSYDAWGNILTISDNEIAKRNPIRYRGYYYDTETGLYYLQSRYYNPQIGRFINGDTYVNTEQGLLSLNMFLYCENNPVVNKDESGTVYHLVIGAAIGASMNILSSWMLAKTLGNEYKFENVLVDGLSGAASGALSASGLGRYAQMAGAGALTIVTSIYSECRGDGLTVHDVAPIATKAMVSATITGLGGSGFSSDKKISKAMNVIDSNFVSSLSKDGWRARRTINRVYSTIRPQVQKSGMVSWLGTNLSNLTNELLPNLPKFFANKETQ